MKVYGGVMATLNVETHHIIQGAQTETEGAGEGSQETRPSHWQQLRPARGCRVLIQTFPTISTPGRAAFSPGKAQAQGGGLLEEIQETNSQYIVQILYTFH